MKGLNARPFRLTHRSSARYRCAPQTAAGSQFSFSWGTQVPRSSTSTLASWPASALAIVPPPAPLPTRTTSKCWSGTGRLFHQPVVLERTFHAHHRGPHAADGSREVVVH